MAKPFNEQVNIQPQTISTGRPQALMSLSQKLDDFSSFTANVAAKKTIEKASIAGQQAGVAQQKGGEALQLKEETFIGGISKKAFNTAAREGYLKSLDNDIIESFSTLATENASNLQGYNSGAQALAKGFLEGVDPASRGAVELSIDSMISRSRPKIQANQAKAVVDRGNSDQAINASERGRLAQSAAFEGDIEQRDDNLARAIDSINNRTDLDAEQKNTEMRKTILETRDASLSGELSREYDANGHQAAYDKLDALDKPKDVTPDEWDAFVRSEQTKISRKIKREGIDLKAAKKEADLAASVARGNALTPGQADPSGSSQDRKDINNYYDSIAPSWAGLPPQEQINNSVDFVLDKGLIPSSLIASTSAKMRGGSPEEVVIASDLMSRLQEEMPASIKDFSEESRAIGLQVTDAQRAGMDTAVALEIARKNAYGLTDTEKDTIKLQAQEVSKELGSSLQGMVNSNVEDGGFDTGIFSNVPDVPVAMLGDYRNSFGRFMSMTGGDPVQSQNLAYDSLKSKWAVTETGGPKRFMPYAPEVVYAVPHTNSNWIENQFNEEVEIAGHIGATIAIDSITAREKSPSYPVFVPDENGRDVPLRDANGENMRFRPDYKMTEQYKELAGAPDAAIHSAKEKRARIIERRSNEIRRGVQFRVLNSQFIPFNERADFMASDEGKRKIAFSIDSMMSAGKIDEVEAQEARNAFGI